MLGVTIGRRFSPVTLTNYWRRVRRLCSLCAPLRQHGLPKMTHYMSFSQATVIAKLTNASPAWWGFVSAEDRARLEAFVRRSVRLDTMQLYPLHLSAFVPRPMTDCSERISCNNGSRCSFCPPPCDEHYELRHRSHNYSLPLRSSNVNDCNFLMRYAVQGPELQYF